MNLEQLPVDLGDSTKTAAEQRRQKDANLQELRGLNPKRGRVLLELTQLLGATDAKTFDVFINSLNTFTPGDVARITKIWQEVQTTAFDQDLDLDNLTPEEKKSLLDEVVGKVG